MDFTVLNQVLILFLIIAIGFVCRRRQILTTETAQKLTELLNKVTMPFLIIISFQMDYSFEKLKDAGSIFMFAVFAHALSAIVVFFLFKGYRTDTKAVMSFAVVFSNCAYMGFPVLEALLGRESIFYASFYTMVFQFFLWSYGIALFKGRSSFSSLKGFLLNPGITAIFIGLILFILSIRLPMPIFKAMDLVGSMTIPVAMLIIGFILAGSDFKNMVSGIEVYIVSILRLIILPIAALVVLLFLGMEGIVLWVAVLSFAMPVAANTAIFAGMYGGDTYLASKAVAVSTFFSIISIPLIVIIVEQLTGRI